MKSIWGQPFAHRAVLVVPLSILALLQSPRPSAQDGNLIAIIDATVVDGSGAPARKANVIIRGKKIEAVGAQVQPPQGARIIPASGHTLMPGLFDVHTHAAYSAVRNVNGDWRKNLKAYLYSGVTTIVDFGTHPETYEDTRRLVREGKIDAPQIILAARFTTPLGHGAELGRDSFSFEVLTPREAAAAFKRVLPYQPDVLKVFTDGWRYGTAPDMTSMDQATLNALVDEAHRHGFEVLTHTVTLEKGKIAARADVDCIAHAISDQPVDDEFIQLLKARGTYYAPTMAVYENRQPMRDSSFLQAVLEPAAEESIRTDRSSSMAPDLQERRKKRWENILHNTRALRQAGIPLALGTDAGVTGTYHGWATLHELELLVSGGLTPLEALQAGTGNPAKFLGLAQERGTIAPGRIADLVLVKGVPHENISDIWKIQRVFREGHEVDRQKLALEINAPAPIPPEVASAREWIDDFESQEGRNQAGSVWTANYESGHDHTRVQYLRIWRSPGNHSLLISAQMAERGHPFVHLVAPLSRGTMRLSDASAYQGIQFDVRGEGDYRILIQSLESRDGFYFSASFQAGAEWKKLSVPFTAFQKQEQAYAASRAKDLQAISFELSGSAGEKKWLELDNVKFYR